jgi:hypothetical protein
MNEIFSDIIHATLTRYYVHCENQSKVKWDKGEDLDVIFKAAREEGWKVQASAGTFWFSKESDKGRIVAEVHMDSYMKDGFVDVEIGGTKDFGAFATITNILAKHGKTPNFINADEHGGIENALKGVVIEKIQERLHDKS